MKNIIFDFGNILITFNDREIVSKFTSIKEEQDFLIENCIYSPEWVKFGLIDSGYISFSEAVTLINDRTNNKYKNLVNDFMLNYYKYMHIQKELINIIKKLKEKGYKIYMLSNTSDFMYKTFIKDIEYLFDGLVLSYQIHKIKPYTAIYEHLINTYHLNPEESLFLDDRLDNIETANKLGIKGRQLKEDNIEDIKQVLKEYNIL